VPVQLHPDGAILVFLRVLMTNRLHRRVIPSFPLVAHRRASALGRDADPGVELGASLAILAMRSWR